MTEYVLRVTFGVQYAREPHPTLTWAHPDGWFEVVILNAPSELVAADEALRIAHRLTGGVYAFDYRPTAWAEMINDVPRWHPLGVLARHTLDMATNGSRFEVFREFRQTMVAVTAADMVGEDHGVGDTR